MPFELPKELFGYEVISQLGEGAASTVYVVNDKKSGQLYAMKHVVKKDDKSQRFFDQLINEFEVSKKIGNHPNIRRAVDLKFNKTLFGSIKEAGLVLDLVDATPLDRELNVRGHANIPWITDVLAHAARGMATLKLAGFVHADMKPENIMVSANGETRIIDLGQACISGTEKERVQGSPNFIAPEQMSRDKITFRTDVFNFGATMYWALTGKYVPTEYTRKKGLARGKAEDAPPPAQLAPEVPADLSAIVMQCVRTKVMERPDNMQTVANQIDAVRKAHPTAPASEQQPV